MPNTYVKKVQLYNVTDESNVVSIFNSAPETVQSFNIIKDHDMRFQTASAGKATYITFELSSQVISIDRKVYSLLDYLGSLGGLAGALTAMARFLILVLQFRALH